MSGIVELLGWTLVAGCAAISAAFVLETLFGLIPGGGASVEGRMTPASTVILVPAHNEATIIGRAMAALKEQLPPAARILLVADNCSDDTAAVARAAGVEVVERNDPALRGKGYALDYGRRHLSASPPEVVIVLDADCRTDRLSVDRLAQAAMASQAPAQAKNLLKPDLQAPPMVQISNFAFLVKNFIRQRGATRLGGAAMLTGTGMAFPWTLFSQLSFSGGSVEDLDLTMDLVVRGLHPVFVPEATVLSDPAPASAAQMQRDRWERGFLAAAAQGVPRLVRRFLSSGKPSLLWLALHLMTPPLALLILLEGSCAALLGLLHLFGGMGPGPFIVQAALLVVIGVLVVSAWAAHGRQYLAALTLFKVPFYIMWKLPIYARMITGAERRWNRTDRIGD